MSPAGVAHDGVIAPVKQSLCADVVEPNPELISGRCSKQVEFSFKKRTFLRDGKTTGLHQSAVQMQLAALLFLPLLSIKKTLHPS